MTVPFPVSYISVRKQAVRQLQTQSFAGVWSRLCRWLRKSVLLGNCMNIQTASAPRTSNIHSRCGKSFAKIVNSLRSDSTVFAHSTSFVHEEVLRLVQIVWIVHTIPFHTEFSQEPAIRKLPHQERKTVVQDRHSFHAGHVRPSLHDAAVFLRLTAWSDCGGALPVNFPEHYFRRHLYQS